MSSMPAAKVADLLAKVGTIVAQHAAQHDPDGPYARMQWDLELTPLFTALAIARQEFEAKPPQLPCFERQAETVPSLPVVPSVASIDAKAKQLAEVAAKRCAAPTLRLTDDQLKRLAR